MLIYPWYAAAMLAMEASKVIDIRLWKFATGGEDAGAEAQLMVSEKLAAATDALRILMTGGTPLHVIESYRKLVAANARRLAR
jgi:hypothetical protein